MTDTAAEHVAARRADAVRNRAAILDAATECLARDPDVSIKDIARAAGVGRVTLYGHYESRAALVEAVVDRAIRQTDADLRTVDLSGDVREAMTRLMSVTWDLTHLFGALVVAAQRDLPSETFRTLHEAPSARVKQLLLKGRKQGAFRTDAPVSWQVMAMQSLLHGAVDAVYNGELRADQARELVTSTVLAVLEAPRAT
jgi:AcrR family transcriptional regulator